MGGRTLSWLGGSWTGSHTCSIPLSPSADLMRQTIDLLCYHDSTVRERAPTFQHTSQCYFLSRRNDSRSQRELLFFFSWKHFLPEVSSEANCCFCLGVNIFRCLPLRNVLCRSNWYMDIKWGVSQRNRGSCLLKMLRGSGGGQTK